MQALDEFQRLGRHAFLQRYGFGTARDYFVVHPVTGLRCDSKAIVGAAYGVDFPAAGPLGPRHFSGGVATVVRVLGGLGFEIVGPGDAAAPAAGNARPWEREELAVVVADYLQMLTRELLGQSFNPGKRCAAMLPLLPGRQAGDIESVRQAISETIGQSGLPRLAALGRPVVLAPWPLGLTDVLADLIDEHLPELPSLERAAERAADGEVVAADPVDFTQAKASAPERQPRAAEPPIPTRRRPVRRDWLEREARNRCLGEAGESFIVDYERWRLLREGCGQLADRVEQVSKTKGDGLGYDVLSFEPDGRERFIEVKTTAFGDDTPFYVSANELAFAREQASQFRLCRVFDFRRAPRFFELAGAFEQHFVLDAASFKARLI